MLSYIHVYSAQTHKVYRRALGTRPGWALDLNLAEILNSHVGGFATGWLAPSNSQCGF